MPLGSAVTPVRTAAMAPIHRSRARRVPPLHVTPVDRASAVALATALLLTSAPPAAHVHAHLLADVGEGAPASGFVERIKAALPKPLQEDPFGGDRVDKTRAPLASTKVGLLKRDCDDACVGCAASTRANLGLQCRNTMLAAGRD